MATACIHPSAQWPTNVVQQAALVRKCRCQLSQLVNLRMIEPGVKREAKRAERPDSVAEAFIGQQSGWRDIGRINDGRVSVPRGDMTNPPKASTAGLDVCLQNVLRACTEPHIGIADDTGAHACPTETSARTHGGAPVDEFCFANGPEFFRTACLCIDRHCRNTVATML